LLLLMQVATPQEMHCLGFIQESSLPLDVYIAGTGEEGMTAFASESGLVYLNGPRVSTLKAGETYLVVRPEGRVRNRVTHEQTGIYYKELGTVRVELVGKDNATATVLVSCYVMHKGDLVVPYQPKPAVKFEGKLSNRLTPYPAEGLTSTIILGKDGLEELATGQFCFIGIGKRDGVKVGDRFTIFRPQPPFNPRDLIVDGTRSYMSYERLQAGTLEGGGQIDKLQDRSLPPRVLGDIVIVEVGDSTATARIIHCMNEVHLGDTVVRR